jgi:HAD superfamily hydrolase (TIGR01458 family)
MGIEGIDGLLLDIDGVLAISWEALPGAVETLAALRNRQIPFRLITNTTTQTRDALSETLGRAGFDVTRNEIVTAVNATAAYLRAHHPGARAFVLSDGNATADLEGIELADVGDADVIVIGGGCDDFTYATLNRVFRRLMDGAPLIGMHRNLYWRTSEGLDLDGGAYIAGLEEAAGVTATICGKPAPAFFESALSMLGVPAERAVMVGDDIVNDVLGAQAAGMSGVLVRTGKYMESDLQKGEADRVIDSIGDLVGLLES